MAQEKVTILDRAFFVSVIFIVPFLVDKTDEYGFLACSAAAVLYACAAANVNKFLVSYFYRED